MKIQSKKISEVVIKSSNNLSKKMLSQLTEKDLLVSDEDRPKNNFVDLVEWTKSKFKSNLKDQKNIQAFIHNKISIDEKFVMFSKEKNLKITGYYKQPIVSWQNDDKSGECFFCQGVFGISGPGIEFLHCALMHKGSSYEDEVSFFVLVSESNYEAYINLRDEYDAWLIKRDRNNSYIRVAGGQDIKYDSNYKWSDLYLPEDTKKELQTIVEGFLGGKKFYQENSIPWKRGVLLYGPPGTGKSSIIKTIISEYDFKPVTVVARPETEDIVEAFNYAEEKSPALLYFEDLDSLLETTDISLFLNLMDGIAAKNGLFVIATANEVKKLKSSITNRPSRFDRKFEIGLPDAPMTLKYLKSWFGSMLTAAKYKELVKFSQENSFSYAYLKELYISSMFEAMANKRKLPTEKDINNALNRLIKDKNVLDIKSSIRMDSYLK